MSITQDNTLINRQLDPGGGGLPAEVEPDPVITSSGEETPPAEAYNDDIDAFSPTHDGTGEESPVREMTEMIAVPQLTLEGI